MKLKELLNEKTGTEKAQTTRLNKATDVKELVKVAAGVKNGTEDAAKAAGEIAKTKFKVKVAADLKKLADAADEALKANEENGGKAPFFDAWAAAADKLGDAIEKKYGARLNRPAGLAFIKAL